MDGLLAVGVLAALCAAGFFWMFWRMRRQQQQICCQQEQIESQQAQLADIRARLHLKDIIENQDERKDSPVVMPLPWLAGFLGREPRQESPKAYEGGTE